MILARGNTSDIIAYGDNKICKLYKEGYPSDLIALDYSNARVISSYELPVPAVFEMICLNGRTGIVFEKIEGRTLWNCCQNNDELSVLDCFVNLHCEILHCQSEILMSYKDFFKNIVKRRTPHNLSLLSEIDDLPDGNVLCHGDFHPNNIMITPDSSAVIIDFLNLCRGTADYDIARSFFLLRKKHPVFARKYLEKMKMTEEFLAPYLNVLEKCREYENFN